MTHDEVVSRASQNGVKLIRMLYCDNGGVIRGKVSHIDGLSGRLRGGIGLTVAMQAFSMLDHLVPFEGMGSVGEVRILPDPNTYKEIPYAPRSAAMVSDLLTLDGKPWGACPRSFLKRMITRAKEYGILVQASMENEFILCKEVEGRLKPADSALCFTTIGMQASAAVIDDMISTFEAMEMPVDLYYPEYGPGQHELTIRHAEALKAADNQIFYRDAVRAVAFNHGFYASLAPKPFPDLPGNGCHIHASLWDITGKTNLLWSESDPYHFSDLGHHFIAGILYHLPALVALTAPSFNSYRRLRPHMWASAFSCWGPDNREGAIRLASPFWGSEADSINFELKACDSSSNPYLALGGMIAAGLDGLARKLDPGEPLLGDPGDMSEEVLSKVGIHRLPSSLAVSLDNLEHDDYLMDALSPLLARSYLTVKRSEFDEFSKHDQDFEIDHHIYLF